MKLSFLGMGVVLTITPLISCNVEQNAHSLEVWRTQDTNTTTVRFVFQRTKTFHTDDDGNTFFLTPLPGGSAYTVDVYKDHANNDHATITLGTLPADSPLYHYSFLKEVDFTDDTERLEVNIHYWYDPTGVFLTQRAGVYLLKSSAESDVDNNIPTLNLLPEYFNSIPEQCTLVLTHYLDYSDSLQVWTMGLPYVDCS